MCDIELNFSALYPSGENHLNLLKNSSWRNTKIKRNPSTLVYCSTCPDFVTLSLCVHHSLEFRCKYPLFYVFIFSPTVSLHWKISQEKSNLYFLWFQCHQDMPPPPLRYQWCTEGGDEGVLLCALNADLFFFYEEYDHMVDFWNPKSSF